MNDNREFFEWLNMKYPGWISVTPVLPRFDEISSCDDVIIEYDNGLKRIISSRILYQNYRRDFAKNKSCSCNLRHCEPTDNVKHCIKITCDN